jgi:hypothetical protein
MGFSPMIRRGPSTDDRVNTVRAVCALVGIVAAVATGIYVYRREHSVWLAVFVAILTVQLIARGVADVITDRKKVRHALYFLLFPASASAIYWLVLQTWDIDWLAFVLAFVGGGIAFAILARLLFPGIHREEKRDSAERMVQSSRR